MYDADATRYEIMVSFVNHRESDYDQQFVVTLVNFGECYFDTDLNFIGQIVLDKSKRLGGIDAKNIQNAIAERFEGVNRVEFDHVSRTLKSVNLTS